MAAVELRNVTVSYDRKPAIRSVSVDLPAGERIAIVGPNGAGKSTLIKAVVGLVAMDSGQIRVHGEPIERVRQRVAYVPQRGVIDWDFPVLVRDVVIMGRFGRIGWFRRPGKADRSIAADALERVGMTEFAERQIGQLSGGQQQRVALARALANRPTAILLDEPFSNLDASLRTSIRTEVQRLLTDLALTAIFVTHDQEEAFVLGDEVAVMLDGAIVQQSTPPQIYDAPASRSVAAFVGDANFLAGSAVGDKADTAVGPVPLCDERHGEVDVLVRPEQLAVSAGRQAVVERVEYYGHDAVYLVRPDGGPLVRVRVMATPRFGGGDRVDVRYVGDATVAYPTA